MSDPDWLASAACQIGQQTDLKLEWTMVHSVLHSLTNHQPYTLACHSSQPAARHWKRKHAKGTACYSLPDKGSKCQVRYEIHARFFPVRQWQGATLVLRPTSEVP